MAERGTGGGKAEGRKPSEFIARLVKDPKNPPEVVEVTGFLGAAGEQGRARIYLDTTLQNYIEVMEDKILHVEPVPDNSLGLSCIFLAADAQVFPPEVAPRAEARNVFGGAVYGDYLNAAGGGVPGVAGGVTPGPAPSIGICQSLTVICQSLTLACQSIAGPCVTRNPICPSIYYLQCPTVRGPICISLRLNCSLYQVTCRTRFDPRCTIHHWVCVGVEIPTEIIPDPGPYAGMPGLEQQVATPYAAQAGMQAQAAFTPQAAQQIPATYVAQICISRQPYLCPVTVRDPACLLHTYTQPHCFLTFHHWQCPPTRPSMCVTCNLIQCHGPSRFSPFCGVSGNAYCGGTLTDPGPYAGGGMPGVAGYDPYAGY